MQSITQIGDGNTSEKALEFFQNKVAFSTGPVELDTIRKETDKFCVIDVREEKDFRKSHIPGAVNIPRAKWEALEGLDRNKLNVVYCYSQVCHLAARACIEFAKAGFRVLELEGGFKAWEDHDLEVENETEKRETSTEEAQLTH